MNAYWQQLLVDDAVFGPQMPIGTKALVFRHVGRTFAARWSLSADQEALMVDSLLIRDQIRTTGVGGGIAMPHIKAPIFDVVRIGWFAPAAPLEFDSIDARPVRLLIVMVSPIDRTSEQMQSMARIGRVLFVEEARLALFADLTRLRTPEQFRDRIQALFTQSA